MAIAAAGAIQIALEIVNDLAFSAIEVTVAQSLALKVAQALSLILAF